jgi:uncharacterized protein YndB with AHSA1/START domain
MKRILVLLLIASAALVAVVWTRPSELRVERSAMIQAPPALVFENLDDFRRWVAWSPWEKRDAAMERRYEGPRTGPGASYYWRGNDEVGEGRMTVIDAKPPTRLRIRLEFLAPMQATNEALFELSPHLAGTTEVRWTMTGETGFLGKAFGLVVDTDALVGSDFEKGLAELKRVSEDQATALEAMRAAQAAEAAAAAATEAGDSAVAEASAEMRN